MARAPRYDGLRPDLSVAAAARSILGALLDATLLHASETLADGDVRAVHDARVAIRRLRIAMATFRGCFPRRRWRRLRREVRDMGRKLGAARDADVHLAALRAAQCSADPVESAGIAHAIDALVARRADALHRFRGAFSAFEQERFGRLLRGTKRTFAHGARRSIAKGWRRLLADAPQAIDGGDDARLHALRIRTKRLRYVLEFAAPLLDDRARVPLRGLALLQERLGALADAAAFANTYAALMADVPPGDARRAGLTHLHASAADEHERALAALRAVWYGAQDAARATHAVEGSPA